jgi:uncharacterized protein (DUF697 family)
MEEQKLNAERNRLANTVIKNHMIWSMGAGFIPIPVADFLAIGAIQVDMVRQLCKLYGLSFKESEGKALVSALTSSGLAKIGARAVIKLIPGFGQIVGGVTLAIFSGASTYALGEVFKRHFESGGTILDFDAEGLKKMYDEKFEKGKELARKIKKEQDSVNIDDIKIVDDPIKIVEEDDLVANLTRLADLKAAGALSEEEYEQAKKKILG